MITIKEIVKREYLTETKDYFDKIKSLAEVAGVELDNKQLHFLNDFVNDRINKGSHESDALDHAYFYIKAHYKK